MDTKDISQDTNLHVRGVCHIKMTGDQWMNFDEVPILEQQTNPVLAPNIII